MIDRFTKPYSAENVIFLMFAVRRQQDSDGLADHLGGCIAKYFAGSAIPAGDDTTQVFSDDGVLGRLHYCDQPSPRLVHLHPLGDVAEGCYSAADIAILIP